MAFRRGGFDKADPHGAMFSDLGATKMMLDIAEVHFNIGRADFARIEPLLKAALQVGPEASATWTFEPPR
jgi:hypothetical protein